MVLALLLTPAGRGSWDLYRPTTSPHAKGWSQYHASRWEGHNLYLDLDRAEALAAMGLRDDGSNLSISFLNARQGAMRDQMQSSSTPPPSSRPPAPLPPSSSGRVVASGTTTAPSQTAVDFSATGGFHSAMWAVNCHSRGATRKLADDGLRYTWEEFATYYLGHADEMWNKAMEREMAIWFGVVARLKKNFRRIRWRIIARNMNRFARASWRQALVPYYFLATRASWRQPSPWDDDTEMHCIGNGASSSTQVVSPCPPPTPVGRRWILSVETF